MRGGFFFGRGYGTISRVADLLCWEEGLPQKSMLIRLVAVGAYMVAIAVTEIRNWHRNGRRRSMNNAKHIYSIADNHAQTVQLCIDRLHELGANEQLKQLTGRLQKLAIRAGRRRQIN
jgi:hypothetical protein